MIELRLSQLRQDSDAQGIYDGIYRSRGIRQLDSFYLWLLGLINPSPGQSLLDVSCGEGQLVQFARQKNIEAFGVDFSEPALSRAQQSTGASVFGVMDAQTLAFDDNSFDYITNIGSIEHYENPAQGIREMSRVLKPSGIACVLLPNTYSLFGNIKHAIQTGEVYQGFQPIERYNTLAGWRRLLINNGLVVYKEIKYEVTFPKTVADFFWYLPRPSRIFHLLLTPLIPLALANCIVYLCRPKQDYPGNRQG
jgi:SAM-dependent methyltransferase